MNIVFCHGVMPPELDWYNKIYNPIKSWKDWLQFTVEADHDVVMQIPKFPHAHVMFMQYNEWENIMNRQDINEDTVLVGHSAGGGFIMKYMVLHPELRVRQIVLVAPWLDVEGFQPFNFYGDTDLRDGMVRRTKNGIDLVISNDDMPYILSSADKIIKNMPSVRVHWFSGRGHFISNELPEIMSIIKFDKGV